MADSKKVVAGVTVVFVILLVLALIAWAISKRKKIAQVVQNIVGTGSGAGTGSGSGTGSQVTKGGQNITPR